MHAIRKNQKHILLNVKIAFNSTDPDEVADGLGEMLRDGVTSEFIADYGYMHSDSPAMIRASDDPVEGELFDKHKTFAVCVIDEGSNTEWLKVESELKLDEMSEAELREHLFNLIHFDSGDRIFVGRMETMSRIVI